MKNKKFKIVSLFSGSGGLDLGFIQAGFDIIWACDIDKSACETYKKNIGDHIHNIDITKLNIKDIPDGDIIIGGSPCQGFSNANRTNHFLDNPKNMLVKEYIRIVKGKQPKIFVLENVPQIITAGKGLFLKEIKDELNEYKITYKILNSVDYGVAQERRRAIIIGSKIGSIEHPKSNINTYKTVRQAFEGLNNDIPNQLDYSKPKKTTIEYMKYVRQGGNFKDIPIELRPKGNHSNLYKRLHYDRPSITITNPRKSALTHPEENRILTIRECARIQSFPDNFIFYGNLAEKQQQVANAVPLLLSYNIALQILNKIEEVNYE